MLTKSYGKTGRVCRVTFKLPPLPAASVVSLCGDFNDWDPDSDIMDLSSDGGFVRSKLLHPGHQYQFRYLINGQRWDIDTEADGVVTNEAGIPAGVLDV